MEFNAVNFAGALFAILMGLAVGWSGEPILYIVGLLYVAAFWLGLKGIVALFKKVAK